MPKVSVILTSFNHEKYVLEAIDSVLNQTFTDYELIIWDDASSDNSWHLIKQYSDPRIKAFRNEEQRRGIWGINNAITEVAKGEYIAIHHSDDVWELDKLEKQVAFLEAHSEIGAVFTNALAIGEGGSPLADEKHFYSSIFEQPNRTRHEWLRYFFIRGNALCHPSVLIRKSCYGDCGLYRFGFAQVGDFDMWIRLCLKHEIHVMPEKFVRFRVLDNEANTSGNRPETRIRGLYEFYRLLSNYREIKKFDDMVKVFPGAEKFYRKRDTDTDFALAMVSLEEKPHIFTQLFGLDLLFEVISDHVRSEKIKRLYDFDYKSFIALTSQHDIFAREDIRQIMSERDRKIASLNQAVVERDRQFTDLNQAVVERDGQIANLNIAITKKDEQTASLSKDVAERDKQIASLNQAVTERDGHIAAQHNQVFALESSVADREKRLNAMLASTSWKISAPVRTIGGSLRILLEYDVRDAVRIFARRIYRMLPLSPTLKLRLRSGAFRYLGPLLTRHSVAPTVISQRMLAAGVAEPTSMSIRSVMRQLNKRAVDDNSVRWCYSRFMQYVWYSRLDLQRVFDLDSERGREGFAKWYLTSARYEYRLTSAAYPAYLLNELAQSDDSHIRLEATELLATLEGDREPLAGQNSLTTDILAIGPRPAIGANLIGYARGEFGMGEHVRMVAKACAVSDTPFSIINFEEAGFHGKEDNSVTQWISNEQKYGTNIFHINADVFPGLFFHFTPQFFNGHVNVGYWAWELANCPEEFDLALSMVDEVWAISEFVRDAFMQRSKVPVINMPLAVSVPELDRPYDKRYFGIPEDTFTFLYTFDAASYLDRKNPIGAVRAFKSAFADQRHKVRLVLKTMNVPENESLWNALKAEIGRDERIQVIATRMLRDEVLGLTSVCDAFISLHRAEGFGRCIAESMLMGKPVIVTNYSGSRDFANEATACAVDYQLVPVPEGSYPFWRGQIWAEPDYLHAGWFMRKLVEDPQYRRYIAEAGQSFIRENFSERAVGLRYRKRLAEIAERKGRAIVFSAITEGKLHDKVPEGIRDINILCNIDHPKREALVAPTVRGTFDLAGWAISPAGVAHVEVLLDGAPLRQAHYGILRSDIGAAWPDIRDSARSGFFSKIDSTALVDGLHTIEVAVHSGSGDSAVWSLDVSVDNSVSAYDEWLSRNATSNNKSIRAIVESMAVPPLLSVGMVVNEETEIALIPDTLRSLMAQVYTCWEIVVCVPRPAIQRISQIAIDQGMHERLRILGDDTCRLATAAADCRGAYLGFVEAGDVLDPRALLAFASSYSKNPSLDLVYSDEDRLIDGRHVAPVFKPGWSPLLFREANYIGRLWFAKTTSVLQALDGLRDDADDLESQILAGLFKDAHHTAHIPMVLYSRKGNTAFPDIAKSSMIPSMHSTCRQSFALAHEGPAVSIIIPTRLSNLDIVERCFVSLFGRTVYGRYEVIVIANNMSNDEEKLGFLKRWPVSVYHWEGAFNWSAINNFGASHASGEYLLFMNDDIEIRGRDWLAAMVDAAQQPGVGVVGATLRYPDGTIQHAGLALSSYAGGAIHLYRFCSGDEPALRPWISVDRECSAVTGACLLTRTSVFHELGGFDEDLPLVCNDTDYCLRGAEIGYRCVVSAGTDLIHYEGISRGGLVETRDVELFRQRWGELLQRGDPYLNPNFLASTEAWAVDPRAEGSLSARLNWLLDVHRH